MSLWGVWCEVYDKKVSCFDVFILVNIYFNRKVRNPII